MVSQVSILNKSLNYQAKEKNKPCFSYEYQFHYFK